MSATIDDEDLFQDLVRAETIIRDRIARAPRDGQARIRLIELHQKRHRRDPEGEERLDEIREMIARKARENPADPMALFELAMGHLILTTHFSVGEEALHEAGRVLRTMIVLDPDEPWGYWGMRRVLFLLSVASMPTRYRESVELCREAIRRQPGNPRGYFELGEALAENAEEDQKDLALEEYRKCLLLDPSHIEAQFRQASLLRILDRQSEARQSYQRVVDLAPSSSWARDARRCLEHMDGR